MICGYVFGIVGTATFCTFCLGLIDGFIDKLLPERGTEGRFKTGVEPNNMTAEDIAELDAKVEETRKEAAGEEIRKADADEGKKKAEDANATTAAATHKNNKTCQTIA